MRALLVAAIVAGAVAAAAPARAGTVRGTVFSDDDGDGVLDAGERGIATVAAWNDALLARTDALGQFTLDASGDGLLWARVPDGFVPGPAWAAVSVPERGEVTVDLPLRPLSADAAAAPLTFVIAADTHLHFDEKHYGLAELRAAITQATTLDPPPRFFAILGDVTQANQPEELDQIAGATAELAVPWVPVAGNHDWYDGGLAWRARFGPEAYSFDAGGAHFVVVNTTSPDDVIVAFLDRELAFVDPAMTIVLMAHAPLRDDVVEVMRRRGVDLFLAGHWHANRVVDHGELLELDTEPFLMGGMDFTPGGYRVVTIVGGEVRVDHRTVVRDAWLRLAAPVAGRCVRAGEPLIVAAAIDARAVEVTARVGDRAIALAAVGGWGHSAALPSLPAGRHPVRLEARAGAAVIATRDSELVVCGGAPAAAPRLGAWPQVGGGGAHLGRQDAPITPPVVERWATAVGGNLASGPVVADGRVFVAVADLARGDTGGVVALDATTGAVLWRTVTELPVRASPAVVGDVVAVSRIDGTVLGLDAASGRERWRIALGAGLDRMVTTLFAAPAADDGVIFVGIQRRLVAVDAATGAERWSVDPVPAGNWISTLAAVAVAGDLVVGVFERGHGGLMAWSRDGTRRWRLPPEHLPATNAAPVIAGDTVYLATGMGDALAIDAADGRIRWARMLTADRHEWGYAIAASPAIAGDTLVVATEHDELWALDAATGDARWTWSPGNSPVYPVHYRGVARGFTAAPVITGDIVWAGATDGTLNALSLATGDVVQRLQLGAPILGDLAAAGDLLVVAGYDGTVHAFAPGSPELPARTKFPLLVVVVVVVVVVVLVGFVLTRWRRAGARAGGRDRG